jgi:hypothetical protein
MSDEAPFEQHPADSDFHRRLPIGEALDASAITDGLPWAFEQITMRPLEPMLVPEKPRGASSTRRSAGTVVRASTRFGTTISGR